jgi:hypothetical protein
VLRRLLGRLLPAIAVASLLVSYAGPAEAATKDPACGVRSPGAFADAATENSLRFRKTVAAGDTLIWNTDDNRTLTPKLARIRFVGAQFAVMARGDSFTIAGQGNLKTGNFGGSLVERKVVRETDASGRTKSRTLRTVRNVFAQGGRTQWVVCPGTKR